MSKTIFLAGGCFWGVEAYFKRLKGVLSTRVGYANGNTAFPRYEDLKSGKATHAETVKIEYDENVISLEKLLEHYLRFVEPYETDRQGHDRGQRHSVTTFSAGVCPARPAPQRYACAYAVPANATLLYGYHVRAVRGGRAVFLL